MRASGMPTPGWRPVSNRNPFDLADDEAYCIWRAAKLANYPSRAEELFVEIKDAGHPTPSELRAIAERCQRANMAFYAFSSEIADEARLRRNLLGFGTAFGLKAMEDHRSAEADGIVRIELAQNGGRAGYIPYTNRSISWHTDGYYNFCGIDRFIGAMLLHCVRDAEGGENRVLDPEIAYIRLRDQDPAHIEALMHPGAMLIPANTEENGKVRPDNVGPVFFIQPATHTLAMRYTARKRNIAWRDDERTRHAVDALALILETDPLVMRTHLKPGQGLICNNVLHDRAGFTASGAGRLLFRIRYFGRIGRAADRGDELGSNQ